MSDWTMQDAKRDFERRLLRSACLVALPMASGWSVSIRSTLGMDGCGWLLDARKREPRQFKTADAAIRAVQEIGFEVVKLEVSK